MIEQENEITRKKNCYYLETKLQDAMRVIHREIRINPSAQIELALEEYLKKYEEVLAKHDIEI